MNRRNFLSWFGLGAIASYLPFALAACSSETTQSTTESTSETNSNSGASTVSGYATVGTVSELDNNGGELLDKNSAAGSLLVVRNSSDNESLSAVNPTCTHRNCTVGWQSDEKVFVCPCHGSKFGTDGQVVKGPATEPLPTYEVKVQNDSILVKNS